MTARAQVGRSVTNQKAIPNGIRDSVRTFASVQKPMSNDIGVPHLQTRSSEYLRRQQGEFLGALEDITDCGFNLADPFG